MKAPKSFTVLEAPGVSVTTSEAPREIPIQLLEVAPWNARKTFDAGALDELTATIQKQGLIQPLIVRPIGEPNGSKFAKQHYEIVAGHRRYRAMFKLNRDTVPCTVRELTDDEAREVGLVDNLQRVDVPAMEEADAYNELKQRLGTAAAIAARVGKDVSYVARRLQLVSLAESPRRALQEKLITIDHALLLARLGVDEQDVNLKWALNVNAGIKVPVEKVIEERIADRDGDTRWGGPWEPQSVLELKHHIEENVGRKLSRAPWSLDDAALLPAAGACSACPSNTKANDTLFSDLAIDEATCEKGACFEEKREAFVQIQLTLATTKGQSLEGPALRVSWRPTSVKPRVSQAKAGSVVIDSRDGFNLFQVFKAGQWIEAKAKSCEHVRSAVTVDWDDAPGHGYNPKKLRKPGEILTVCIASKCKAHPKEWEKPKRASGERYDPKAEEAEREKRKQAAIVESKIRMAAATKAVEQIKAIPLTALRFLIVDALPDWTQQRRPYEALMPGIAKIVESAKLDSVDLARAIAVATIDKLTAYEHSDAKEGRAEFLASLKRLGYDGSGAWVAAKAESAKPAKASAAPAAAKPAKKKSILSAAVKKRIADAQRKRWAAAKKGARK